MAKLPENDRIAGPFIAVAGQTDFPADFPLIDATGLRACVERAGVQTILSGVALAAVDEGPAGFTCRIDPAARAGDRVWIYSDLPAARQRAHTPNGAIRTPTLEGDAEGFQAQLQEQRRDLSRAVLAPVGRTPPNPQDVIDAAELVGTRALTSLGNVSTDDFSEKVTRPAVFGAMAPVGRSRAVEKAQNLYVFAEDLGVVADNVTDDAPAWNAIIAAYRDSGRSVIVVTPQKGISRLGATFVNDAPNILIQGPGTGVSHDAGGAPGPFAFAPMPGFNGTLLKHCSPPGPTKPKIHGGGFVGVSSAGLPYRFLHVQSVDWGRYDYYVGQCSGPEKVRFDCLRDYRAGAGLSQLGEAGDNQQFELIHRSRSAPGEGGEVNPVELVLSGFAPGPGMSAASGNTSVVRKITINARTHNGPAVVVENADNVKMEIRHACTGTGAPAIVRGSVYDLTAFGLGENIDIHYTSPNAAIYEGVDTAGVDLPASGIVTLDRSNGTPAPIRGVGAKVLVLDPNEVSGLRALRAVVGSSAYDLALGEAVNTGQSMTVVDGGAGGLLMVFPDGAMDFAEQDANTLRMRLFNGFLRLLIAGGLNVQDYVSILSGGVICSPFEGWGPALGNGQFKIDYVDGSSPTLRFQLRRPNGVLTLATLPMTPV